MFTFTLTPAQIAVLQRATSCSRQMGFDEKIMSTTVMSHRDGTYTLDRAATERLEVLARDIVEIVDEGCDIFENVSGDGVIYVCNDSWHSQRIAQRISFALRRVLRSVPDEPLITTS